MSEEVSKNIPISNSHEISSSGDPFFWIFKKIDEVKRLSSNVSSNQILLEDSSPLRQNQIRQQRVSRNQMTKEEFENYEKDKIDNLVHVKVRKLKKEIVRYVRENDLAEDIQQSFLLQIELINRPDIKDISSYVSGENNDASLLSKIYTTQEKVHKLKNIASQDIGVDKNIWSMLVQMSMLSFPQSTNEVELEKSQLLQIHIEDILESKKRTYNLIEKYKQNIKDWEARYQIESIFGNYNAQKSYLIKSRITDVFKTISNNHADGLFFEKEVIDFFFELPDLIEQFVNRRNQEDLFFNQYPKIIEDRDGEESRINNPKFLQYEIPHSKNTYMIETNIAESLRQSMKNMPAIFLNSIEEISVGGGSDISFYDPVTDSVRASIGGYSPNSHKIQIYFPLYWNVDSNLPIPYKKEDLDSSNQQAIDDLNMTPIEQIDYIETMKALAESTLYHEVGGHNVHHNVLNFLWLKRWTEIYVTDDISINKYVRDCREGKNFSDEVNDQDSVNSLVLNTYSFEINEKIFFISRNDSVAIKEDLSESMALFLTDPFQLKSISLVRFEYIHDVIETFSTEEEWAKINIRLKQQMLDGQDYHRKYLFKLGFTNSLDISEEDLRERMKNYYLDPKNYSNYKDKYNRLKAEWYKYRLKNNLIDTQSSN